MGVEGWHRLEGESEGREGEKMGRRWESDRSASKWEGEGEGEAKGRWQMANGSDRVCSLCYIERAESQ